MLRPILPIGPLNMLKNCAGRAWLGALFQRVSCKKQREHISWGLRADDKTSGGIRFPSPTRQEVVVLCRSRQKVRHYSRRFLRSQDQAYAPSGSRIPGYPSTSPQPIHHRSIRLNSGSQRRRRRDRTCCLYFSLRPGADISPQIYLRIPGKCELNP